MNNEIKRVWNDAITYANNLCVQISNDFNGDDLIVEANTADLCAKKIRAAIDDVHPDVNQAATPTASVGDEAVRWISVDDRLPEIGVQVIVARPNEYSKKVDILMAYLGDSGEVGRSCGRLYESKWLYGKYWSLPAVVTLDSITHWQPLPNPPQSTPSK